MGLPGRVSLSALFMLMAALLNISTGRFSGISSWVKSSATLAYTTISAVVLILEFALGYEFIDPFFKKKQSINVIGAL